MSIQNKERKKSVCISLFVSFQTRRKSSMYVLFAFFFWLLMEKCTKGQKNLFTVLTEEASIPDDDDIWDK
jgi:hypothetical protein